MSHIDQQVTRIPEHYCMGDNSNTNDKYGVPSSWKMAQSILGKRSSSSVKEAQLQSVYLSMHQSTQDQNNFSKQDKSLYLQRL